MRRFLGVSAVLSIAIAAFGTGVAQAADPPQCVGDYSQRTILSDQGSLESVIVGNGGKLYFSGSVSPELSRLYKVPAPGEAPVPVMDGPGGPGGLAWAGRRLLWGYGNSFINGVTGDADPKAGLYSVNPSNGTSTVISDHLGMANGIARGKDGTIFASNDLGQKLDEITPEGETINGWATLDSANGMTISRNGKYLYANQSGLTSSSDPRQPSRISRIEIADPAKIITYFESPVPGNLIFDGLTRDDKGNLYTAVFSRGEVWKIDQKKRACVLATNVPTVSSVAYSTAKSGFRNGNLFAVNFGGQVVKVKNAAGASVPG